MKNGLPIRMTNTEVEAFRDRVKLAIAVAVTDQVGEGHDPGVVTIELEHVLRSLAVEIGPVRL